MDNGERGVEAAIQPLPPVASAAERAAAQLRTRIFEGRIRPGEALPEASVAGAFAVSRNTVREAYRLLANEHLLISAPRRGMLVRRLSEDDLRDIYRVRRHLEGAAVDAFDPRVHSTDAIWEAVGDALEATREHQWTRVGTANLRFHEAIVAFLGSPRWDRFFHGLMTELRLGFGAIADPRALHEPYVDANRRLAEAFAAPGFAAENRRQLHEDLMEYLTDAEARIAPAVHAATHARAD